ncbi:hypothetical protein KO02_13290 [Sphingobacterium sp. ML3W]|uniref:AraC family transcriptional regulator n=1 Tax=Sphingobacterium sp. ML3W TaxID=1538644 RepID=UPI0004F5FCF4|nr:helix-turn-helix domain-containing protein [Sphingobacterium sp. ML3W]AIM37553.1 hypothetical protein KO02_13290 [Sphingobacterium sp. ML3W]
MIRSIIFNPHPDAKEIMHPDQLVTYPMRHADSRYWEFDDNQFAEQTFDGRYAYLYYYEFWISTPVSLSFSSIKPDLHICYPLESTGYAMLLTENETTFNLHLKQQRGLYLYIPETELMLTLPAGHHIITGITLDAGLFRPNQERPFEFLMPLVQAKRTADPRILYSMEFMIGPLTYNAILTTFDRINPKVMDNEYVLLHHQIYLIYLSRHKILTADTKHSTTVELIENARDYLQLTINKFGAKARIQDIAKSLQIDPNKLYRIHQQLYNCSFQEYRNQLLLGRIIQQLHDYPNQYAALAEELNFSGPSELNRFFKKKTGQSLSQYKRS